MALQEPYSPDEHRFECPNCNARRAADGRPAMCPDCETQMRNITVPRE